MKFFAVTDNIDTQMGMRLAGIESLVIHKNDELIKVMEMLMERKDIGVIILTEKVISLNPSLIYRYKLTVRTPLIVEIPDRHGSDTISKNISKYISESVGMRI